MDRPSKYSAIPWLQLILKGIFADNTTSSVWPYTHPATQEWLIQRLLTPTPDAAEIERLKLLPSDELDEAVLAFFRLNLDGYDYDSWTIYHVPQLVGPGLEEYLVAMRNAAGKIEAGVPVEGYRIMMEHDPDIEPGWHPHRHQASWYLVGINGEILKYAQ